MAAEIRSLEGKVALVTGASRGIGAAAAKRLAQSGAKVVVNYHRNKEAALAVLAEIENYGVRGLIFQADVTKKDEVDRMAKAARHQLGPIDILVNNAYFPFEIGALHQLSWESV